LRVKAVLYSSKTDDEKLFIHLETLLSFTKDAALKMAVKQQKGTEIFPVTRLQVQQPPQPSFSRLALLTDIRVFNEHTLTLNESSLTIPQYVYNLHSIKTWPAVFYIQYSIFPVPGFIVSTEMGNGT
jgi:hypothetical protein